MIVTARRLANASRKKPRQADLRRSVSTAYYALFHALARDAADLLVGAGAARVSDAWSRAYRALDHGPAKQACRETRAGGFVLDIVLCADAFVELQEARHAADYDPSARFTRAEVLDWVGRADGAIAALRGAPKGQRRAFAVRLLLKRR